MIWRWVHALSAGVSLAFLTAILWDLFTVGNLMLEARPVRTPMNASDVVLAVASLMLLGASSVRAVIREDQSA